MGHHVIKYKSVCSSCDGTGVYVGIGEANGAAVECHTCKGTGCYDGKVEYDDFDERKERKGVRRVFCVNPGIGIGESKERGIYLKDFGGMPYSEWISGMTWKPGMEDRNHTCPAWWYQSADYKRKPEWDECWESIGGGFSKCKYFGNKAACWARWDKDQK